MANQISAEELEGVRNEIAGRGDRITELEVEVATHESDNECLHDLHSKAVAEAVILLVEKDEYKEEVERLREALEGTPCTSTPIPCKFLSQMEKLCPRCQALAPKEKP